MAKNNGKGNNNEEKILSESSLTQIRDMINESLDLKLGIKLKERDDAHQRVINQTQDLSAKVERISEAINVLTNRLTADR